MRSMVLKRKHHLHKPHSQYKNLDLNHIKKSLTHLNSTAHLKKNVDHYVHKKPYRSMGLIMLAGICIGYFIPRL